MILYYFNEYKEKINNFSKLIFIIYLFVLLSKDNILIAPLYDKPLVSIIIPVHNKFIYTYNCIHSIIKINPIVPYEIIIADDMSTDKTKEIEKIIKNIIVIHNDKIFYFLINCNKASKFAKGKYLIFLNNDTLVHKEWLSSLLLLIESDEKIGMVGSKFLFPNGKLKEAGGIVWNDGEPENFGKNKKANMPEYNYVKEVDYISGASFIIRKSLWEIIGGFDERFSPSYFEDTDLAFTLRKYGYKVMYQPKSTVIHYEGISNGKDLKSGIKKYQERNKEIFVDKWKNELKSQENKFNYFNARDRGYGKNRILVIDIFVPSFDKNAGGRCTFLYLNLFIEIGLKVTLMPNDFHKIEPYTTILQQKGIEVLYGEKFKKNYKIWLKDNLHYFKYVYLQRPDNTNLNLDIIMKYFKGKIIYFAHDLHFLRLYREYNITHNEKKLKDSEFIQKVENNIFSKVDVIHVVGNFELNYLKENYPNKIIRNIPLFFYSNHLSNIEKDFSKRKDFIFVGSSHSPNIDGVLWFYKEVFPNILKKFQDIIWYIIGNYNNDEINKLESKNIKIKNYLSDEELYHFYQKCRIAIAPLRFGAGIKGKIVEAAYNQIPVITTSIGVEGLDNTTDAFIVEDDSKKMSEIFCDLYSNYTKLKLMSDSGKLFIEKFFSKNKAKKIIMKDIN